MCGIAGIINLGGGKSYLGRPIERMAFQMRNRGPDDEGFLLADLDEDTINHYFGDDTPDKSALAQNNGHINEASEFPSQVAFGHRRLSIVDLSASGHQPMGSSDGNYWMIFNGEIYNYKEIAKELEGLGHHLVSGSDTEVLLKSYLQWGDKCLEKFNGMFAFAILDKEKKQIFIARDRMGIKPFFYTIKNNHFIFASDIKTIIASGLYNPDVNWEGLWHNLSFPACPQPLTTFKDVVALEAGHHMRINLNDGQFTKQKYWDIPIGTQDLTMSESDAVDLLESEMTRSIKYRLIADVEVGTFMSGGFDSTTISAIASKLHTGIKAFTLGFEDIESVDELPQAKETAAMHNMEHIIRTVKSSDIYNNIDEMVLGFEEPFYSLSPDYILTEFVKENNIKVILNGAGGDELFAGYPLYKFTKYWKQARVFSPLLKMIPNGLGPNVDLVKGMGRSDTPDKYFSEYYSMMMEFEKKQFFNPEFDIDSTSIMNKLYNQADLQFTDDIEALNYYDLKLYLTSHLLYRIDQFTMRHSIEGRVPLVDHNLVEAAFRIPSKYKMQNGIQKYVLRKVAEKYIAPSCFGMKKKGFTVPVSHWINNELSELTKNSIESLKKREIFNDQKIDLLYKRFRYKKQKKLWQLVMLELWMQKFIDGKAFENLDELQNSNNNGINISVKQQNPKVKIDINNEHKPKIEHAWNTFSQHIGFGSNYVENDPDITISNNESADIQISEKFIASLDSKTFSFANLFEKEPLIYNTENKPDYLSTSFYMLNCLQEYGEGKTDQHGRFSYKESYQHKFNCINENLVGQYFNKLHEQLPQINSNFKRPHNRNKFFVSHDNDTFYGSLFQDSFYALKKLRVDTLLKLLYNEIIGRSNWFNLDRIMDIEEQFGVKSTFFWLVNQGKVYGNVHNADYDIKSNRIQSLIKEIERRGFTNGLHKSFSDDSYSNELEKLGWATALNRNHFLKIKMPDSLRQMEEAGIKMDFSLGFAEMSGFRNNYSMPFKPFDMDLNRQLDVVSIPLHVMDASLWHYQKLSSEKAEKNVLYFLESNKENTLFSILWHNKFFSDYKFKGYKDVYKRILEYMRDNHFENVCDKQLIEDYC